MKTSDFYYDLPEGLIAQTPVEPRDSARLLVMNKETGELTHTIFNKIGDFLKEGDLLVVNNTKVIPARLYGYRADKESVTKYEALLLRRMNFTDWECIMRPARKATVGARLKFSDELLPKSSVSAKAESGRCDLNSTAFLKTYCQESATCRSRRTFMKNSKIRQDTTPFTAKSTAARLRPRQGFISRPNLSKV